MLVLLEPRQASLVDILRRAGSLERTSRGACVRLRRLEPADLALVTDERNRRVARRRQDRLASHLGPSAAKDESLDARADAR